MKRRKLAAAFVGAIVALIGLVWFLQGAGMIHMCPVFCVMDCECVTGGSQFWEAAGAITFIVGVLIIVVSMRCVRDT
jgi:hypothetical protein